MKLFPFATALLVLSPVLARADDQQAYLGIFAETSSMKMAGMPAMPALPKLPPGVKLPPQAQAMFDQGKAHRTLTVRLWSPGIAKDDAAASLAVPEGLKQGPKLDLDIFRPRPESGNGGDQGGQGNLPADTSMTIKQYWGSSATVKPGQPVVIEFGGLTDEQKAAIRRQAARNRRAAGAGSYFYKPDWTTGYWPSEKQPGQIDEDAALPGHYALTTNYTGNVDIDVPDQVNFLAPIEMSSPDLSAPIPLDQAITFHWKSIPNILGYYAQIFGMQGQHTIILWSSSEVKPEQGMGFGYFGNDYPQMSEVRDLVKNQIFMDSDRVEVTVPAGIFQDCDIVTFQMVGYGPGTALDKGQPLPRVQTRTTLMITLGGKMMPHGRGGFSGGGTPEDNP
ncbi:MAG TPA: hypothetical protein VFA07_18625 [Chthonomonadaceae bacterium]|nr:hypothetical protein [Chthonomonadaceae bacterium]